MATVETSRAGDRSDRSSSQPAALAESADGWRGLPVALRALPGRGEHKDLWVASAGVALALSGHGKRRLVTGHQAHDLYTAPRMLEFWEEDSTWDRYQFDGEPGEVIAIELPIAVTTRLLQDASGRPRLCERHEIFDDRLAQLIYMMWDAASSQVPRGGLYAEGLSLSLLGLLLRDYCKDPMATRRSNCLSPRQRARVLAFIDAELGSKLTVAQLAEVVGMSPFHFARQFRETFGQSPYAFVSERRVEAACLALRRQPSVSVAAVAMGHGFYSQQHFTEAFKRRMGTTPSRWRAEL